MPASNGPELPAGLYDRLLTTDLHRALLSASFDVAAVDDADQTHRFARHVAGVLASHLPDLDVAARLKLVTAITNSVGRPGDALELPPRVLTAVRAASPLGTSTTPAIRPEIPLSEHDLLVNGRGEPHLASELKKEIVSADRIDLIVAFVRWYGVRLLLEPLEDALSRHVPVRLLTTTYTGSTEQEALDRLVERGVEVRVSYDTATTRLHAKSWLFHRNSGFSTAYVGSSNVTRSALLDGREWNVRLSADASPALFAKLTAAFDAYWASPDFEPYDPSRDGERLRRALGRVPTGGDASELSGLALRPWPYQEEILEALENERRSHGSWRNLVVAPTGTGKTVVAALDYRRLRTELGGNPSLLFVAHRERILRQSRRTFREALSEGSFGELFVGGHVPDAGRHVFASIQTLNAGGVARIDPGAFDVLIVDEFHHAEASTYRRLLEHLTPRVLLALTATPERADGLDIRRWTNSRTAFDMRLWHALDRQLLAPFQYFGVADTTDVSSVRWDAGRYNVGDLGRVYTGNDIRAELVLRQVRRIVADMRGIKAFGFCATVDHAEYMAKYFNDRGIPSDVVSGDTSDADREAAIGRLVRGELNVIFSRDVFNEGVDVPQVDTILLLRPTESVTVFLQQLGRGLRRHESKDVCTVLDFVANYRREFRWDWRLHALSGIGRRGLIDAAESDFPYLPTGCHIELERQAKEWIIEHLNASVATGARALRSELQTLSVGGQHITLREFLAETGLELQDVGRVGGWARLRRAAGLEMRPASAVEDLLQRGVRRLYHVDDPGRLEVLLSWLQGAATSQPADERRRRIVWMFLVTLYGLKHAPATFEDAAQGLWQSSPVLEELREVLQLLRDVVPRVSLPLPDEDVPLRIGATYGRDEILAAFGRLTPAEQYSHQAGPWWHEPAQTAVLFITLRKTEKDYSPQTLYRDFAISRELFHWESQHSTTIKSTQGQRYLNQCTNGVRIMLAVREAKTDAWGTTMPYMLLGPADYVSHEREQPIAITWRLQNPIPADVYDDFRVAAA